MGHILRRKGKAELNLKRENFCKELMSGCSGRSKMLEISHFGVPVWSISEKMKVFAGKIGVRMPVLLLGYVNGL